MQWSWRIANWLKIAGLTAAYLYMFTVDCILSYGYTISLTQQKMAEGYFRSVFTKVSVRAKNLAFWRKKGHTLSFFIKEHMGARAYLCFARRMQVQYLYTVLYKYEYVYLQSSFLTRATPSCELGFCWILHSTYCAYTTKAYHKPRPPPFKNAVHSNSTGRALLKARSSFIYAALPNHQKKVTRRQPKEIRNHLYPHTPGIKRGTARRHHRIATLNIFLN